MSARTHANAKSKKDGGERPSKKASRGAGAAVLGSGKPLDRATRTLFEPLAGIDLGGVRVFDDGRAASANAALQSRSFALGSNIVLGRKAKREDLTHEIAHVAQASKFSAATGRETELGARGDSAEREADRAGRDMAAGRPMGAIAAQPANVIRRQDDENTSHADPGVSIDPSLSNANSTPNACSIFDIDIDVEALTNAEFDMECRRVDSWLQSNSSSSHLDANSYRALRTKLRAERRRRIGLGHLWMSEAQQSSTTALYMLVPGANGRIDVVRPANDVIIGPPKETPVGPILSEGQFHAFLGANSLPTIDAEEYQRRQVEAMLTGGDESGATDDSGFGAAQRGGGSAAPSILSRDAYNAPFDIYAQDPFARPLNSASGREIMKWRGRFGEAGYQSSAGTGFGLFIDDTNARGWTNFSNNRAQTAAQENFPVFDFERTQGSPGVQILGETRISVKLSLGNRPDRFSYYREGMAAMLDTSREAAARLGTGNRPTALGNYMRNDPALGVTQNTGPQYEQSRSQVLQNSFIAVNSDDAADFRKILADPAGRETPQSTQAVWDSVEYRRIYQGVMRDQPVSVQTPSGPLSFNSPDALDTALRNNQITADQHLALRREAGRRTANKVVSSGVNTSEVANLRTSRAGINLPEAQLRPLLSPEFMSSEGYGGGVRGNTLAAGRAGMQGAGMGSVVAVITTAGVMLIDEQQHPQWRTELATSGGLGALGGGVGSASEQAIVSGGTQYLIRSAEAGAATRLTPGIVRLGGRFGGAGLGAAAVDLFSMGVLEERKHSGTEIGVRTTRAFVLGGVSAEIGAAAGSGSIILATAIAGAAGGSIAPGVGTAIGFIVGLAVGAIAYAVMDKVTPGGKEYWDEQAQSQSRSTSSSVSNPDAVSVPGVLYIPAQQEDADGPASSWHPSENMTPVNPVSSGPLPLNSVESLSLQEWATRCGVQAP